MPKLDTLTTHNSSYKVKAFFEGRNAYDGTADPKPDAKPA